MWADLPEPSPVPEDRHPGSVVAQPVVAASAAGLLLWQGHAIPAVIVAILGATVAILGVVQPERARQVTNVILAITRPLGLAVSAVAAALVQLLVFAPIAVVQRLSGRDPLSTAPASTYWIDTSLAAAPDLARRQFSLDTRIRRQRAKPGLLSLARTTVTLVSVVLVLNLLAGFAYERVQRRSAPQPRAFDVTMPALSGAPWRLELEAELRRQGSQLDSLMGPVRNDFAGQFMNIDRMMRRTYTPQARGADLPTVYFFGGSTMFGTGQRDLHTIPSAVARRAEVEGRPINAVNYGQGSFVIWQEIELLERLLTTQRIPDVAVFYNGANEISTQVSELNEQPSYPQAAALLRRVRGQSVASAVYTSYARHSAIHKVRNRLRERPRRPLPGADLTAARARNAARLHERAVSLISHLSRSYGFRALYFWQPTVFDKAAGEQAVLAVPGIDEENWSDAYRLAGDLVAPPTIDLRTALNDVTEPVYIDRVHTNERGASVVADAMYDHVIAATRAQ